MARKAKLIGFFLEQLEFPAELISAYMDDIFGMKPWSPSDSNPREVSKSLNQLHRLLKQVASAPDDSELESLFESLMYWLSIVEFNFVERLSILQRALAHPCPFELAEALDDIYFGYGQALPSDLKFVFANAVLADTEAPEQTASLLLVLADISTSKALAEGYVQQVVTYSKRIYLAVLVEELKNSDNWPQEKLQALILTCVNPPSNLSAVVPGEAHSFLAMMAQIDALVTRRVCIFLCAASSPKNMADFLKLTRCLQGQSMGLLRHEIEVVDKSQQDILTYADGLAQKIGRNWHLFFKQKLLESSGYTAYQKSLFLTSNQLASEVVYEQSTSPKKG